MPGTYGYGNKNIYIAQNININITNIKIRRKKKTSPDIPLMVYQGFITLI
jgi:hypothetical protein